ncbi:diguanylate cyclase [Halomonas campisalis]|uniref:Diguanylate cyclase n=1 Tax=Billgrantia campisalis TaxID=74661 RepID=A0ABS9P4V0_9GAMM|nr:diguanylate cyclase [Halomonas campisalis]MCG6656272.1 diguanylate cyclase [Halomonas campisalis]MDR5861459.1 diguanylate cyclase [Halomonas campisalis]
MNEHSPPPPHERVSSLATHPARLVQKGFEQGQTGMVITDAKGHIVLANPAFCRLTGCEPATASGQPIEHFFASLHEPANLPAATNRTNASAATPSWQQEVLCRHQEGESQPILMTVDALLDDKGRPSHYLRTFINLASQDGSRIGGRHWVHVDTMTGLPNWLLLRDRLNHALAQAERADQGMALLFIDIDRFKAINDTAGHLEGDRLLGELARRLNGSLRSKDTLARLGGDQFVILLEKDATADAAQAVAERLQEALEPPFIANGQRLLLTASIGIALFPSDAQDEESLITGARSAMYTARKRGPGRLAFVNQRLTTQLKEKHRLENQLSEAAHLPEKYFDIHYQPELATTSGRCVGLKAVLRWRQTRRGKRMPADFLDIMNRLRLGVRLDRWAISRIIADRQRWIAEGLPSGKLPVSVTLSESHLAHDTFDRRPLDHFLRSQETAPLEWLTLEVPEGAVTQRLDDAIHMLKRIEKLGVRLAVSGLGTQPIDLAWLARLPFHQARLSASLTSPANDSERNLAKALCHLLDSLCIEPVITDIDDAASAALATTLPAARVLGDQLCPALAPEALDKWHASHLAAEP